MKKPSDEIRAIHDHIPYDITDPIKVLEKRIVAIEEYLDRLAEADKLKTIPVDPIMKVCKGCQTDSGGSLCDSKWDCHQVASAIRQELEKKLNERI